MMHQSPAATRMEFTVPLQHVDGI